jgi:hypothetical protein
MEVVRHPASSAEGAAVWQCRKQHTTHNTMEIPHKIQTTLEVALRLSIKDSWKFRSDEYWRNWLKREIAALRYIRK